MSFLNKNEIQTMIDGIMIGADLSKKGRIFGAPYRDAIIV